MRNRPRTTAALLLSLLTVPVVLTGCGGGEPDEQSSSSATATESTSAEEPTAAGATDAPSFPGNADPDTAEASSDALATVSDIRLGRHDAFDRVVFEVGGSGTPGWDVRYVDQAVSQGSGDAVEVAGDAVLQVTLTGMGYPYDTGVEEYAGGPLTADETQVVTEVAFVGTAGRTPFRVYALESPARVVVEVADVG